ncbi:hypothetical protein [Roseinatronobacter sp.]
MVIRFFRLLPHAIMTSLSRLHNAISIPRAVAFKTRGTTDNLCPHQPAAKEGSRLLISNGFIYSILSTCLQTHRGNRSDRPAGCAHKGRAAPHAGFQASHAPSYSHLLSMQTRFKIAYGP